MCASAIAVITSLYSGSPSAPGSLVRSSTAIAFTPAGNAFTKCSAENGRYSRTFSNPTFSPCLFRYSTVSRAVSAPEPIRMITRSASGGPKYSNSRYWRPVSWANLSIACCMMPANRW